jgi:gamma-glutamylcyclotransferase (GGCT)/AIG2-like uncharacterized protein YtfP
MPLLFSYGTLQQEEVQLKTFGRKLTGEKEILEGYEPSLVRIEDPQVAARLGKKHHDNAKYTGEEDSRIIGMVFEITDAELALADTFEAEFSYKRVDAMLTSGQHAWVYVHAPS